MIKVNKHYLRNTRVGRLSLRYFAKLDWEWVALAISICPTLSLKARDREIGGCSPRQRMRRYNITANNSRYLLLAGRKK